MDVRDMHPKRKGSLGEAKVAAELIRRGFPVFTEFGDLSRTDLVAEMPDGRLVKVQVKCRRLNGGVVKIDREKSGPGYRYRYRPGDVDAFALYVYDRDEFLWIPADVLCTAKRALTFRFSPTRNGQHARVRLAERFQSFEAALVRRS